MTKTAKCYESPPVVSQSSVLIAGALVVLLAHIWAPILLLVAYGLSILIPYCFHLQDDPAERRCRYQDYLKNAALPEHLRSVPDHIQLEERYWVNSRGMALLSTVLEPKNSKPKALVVFLHGYTDDFCVFKQYEYRRLVNAGLAVTALEIEGHGRSDGQCALIYDWKLTVNDIVDHLEVVRCRYDEGTKVFLVGESMGGAFAFNVCEKLGDKISGCVLVAPMCKIADDMLPPAWVVELLERMIGEPGSNTLLGYLPVAPSKNDLDDMSFKIAEKRNLNFSSPLSFTRKPRLSSAREMIEATRYISKNLASFQTPFLVLHGKADRVTDPKLSQVLYEESQSKDKSIKLYDGMYHALVSGEPDENVDLVFKDMIDWFNKRL